ncbi:MacB family efflux pump subunit [Niveispirillum fermenti]|uniref:MacB family efflux pump subunit n=1 Tax=Niveispirillum fermenti TaxID=1233113 RepID=UPI003A8BEC1A
MSTPHANGGVTPLIELVDITKTYSNGDLAVQVLKGVSLKIHPGEFVAIMGASGSGKSTLMNILGCLDRPTTGQYLFDGRDVSTFDRDMLALLRREAFGFVFQSYNLIPMATAAENVEVPAVYAGMGRQARQERAGELLSALGLADRMDHRPSQLSGGQQQRVSIARALVNGGQVILADEPTGALDSRSGEEVMRLLSDLASRGHTVILITHDRDVAGNARRLVEIKDGQIVADGPTPHALEAAAPPPVPVHPVTVPEPGQDSGWTVWELAEAFRMARRALSANLYRTVLTLLGIVIGVASVVTMLAVGNGSERAMVERISAMGTNLLVIRPGAPGQRNANGVATLVPEDADAIHGIPNVIVAVPEYSGNMTARAGNMDYQTQVTATSPGMQQARAWEMAAGTFFDDAAEDSYAPVAVIGQTVANNLFAGADPVGQYILLRNVPFQVIGVLAPKGASPVGQDQDDVVFVPLTTGSYRVFGQRNLRSITVLVDDLSIIGETEALITSLLTARHQAEDFQVRNTASFIDTLSAMRQTMTILLGSIAAISLLVGGIGVMNIMLVNVTERTREIGIRMATGARARHVMQQFLLEALLVSALGGVIGVALGISVSLLLTFFGVDIQLTLPPMMLAFGCAFATGLIFGYTPARRAALLDPVVALAAD